MIHVPDVRATVEWYKDIGFEVVATYADEPGEELTFAIVAFGDSQVMFNEDGEPSTKQRSFSMSKAARLLASHCSRTIFSLT